MDEPLGRSIGTGIEVIEAREFLRGNDVDERSRELILRIVTSMIELGGGDPSEDAVTNALDSGRAYEKFLEMVRSQGSSRETLEAMRVSEPPAVVRAPDDGYASGIDVVRLGNAARRLTDADDFGGIRMRVRIGDRLERGAPLADVHGPGAADVAAGLADAFTVSEERVDAPALIYGSFDDRERSTSETK
jgi:thymidine phosphorylase